MKFTQVNDEYVLEDSPGVMRFKNALFAAVGLIAIGWLFQKYLNSPQPDAIEPGFGLLISLPIFSIGLWKFFTPVSKVKLSTKHKRLILYRQNLIKINKTLISFLKISRFIVSESYIGDDPHWKVDLQLKTGEIVELTKVWNDYGIIVLDGGETHSSFTYVIDRSGNLRLKIEAETDPNDMASDLKIL